MYRTNSGQWVVEILVNEDWRFMDRFRTRKAAEAHMQVMSASAADRQFRVIKRG